MNRVESYVTGANGFLGRHLFKRLPINSAAIEHEDIYGYPLEDFDNFYFLSTYGNLYHHQNEVGNMLDANIRDLNYVLRLILKDALACETFLYMSSSSVTLPVQTSYSRMKRAGEEMVLAMPFNGCVVRPYSITGVGEQKEHLIPKLIRSCMEGEKMDFVPYPVHDYVDVADVVDGLLWLTEKKMSGIHEFGSCRPVSNEEVLAIVEKACGKKANLNVVKRMRDYDDSGWYCHKSSGIRISKELEQSISEMVEAYDS
jgi:nucleoside-diphosphate-sugar epimerase